MLTSIPFEDGWKIKVDGETIDFYDKDKENDKFTSADNCATVFMQALIGLKLTPGQHTIEMSYTPPGLIPGLGLLLAGLACVVLIYRYDKKNNKILLAKKRGDTEPEPEPAPNAKKGKGKKDTAAKDLEDIDTSSSAPEAASQQQTKPNKKKKNKKPNDRAENVPKAEQASQTANADSPKASKETSKKSDSGFFIDAVMPDDIEHEEALRRLAEAEAKLKVLEEAEAKLKALEEREQNRNKKGRGKNKKK